MGSASSKFRKHLQNGDEYAALQLYQNNSDLRKGLNPNLSYGDSHGHDTPLHFAGRHGMKTLLKIFLFTLGGNPNKKNGADETVLHLVCQANNGHTVPVRQRRADCVALILKWRGATLQDGEIEKADLGSQDQKHNLPLHYAAEAGLKQCVELLVNHGSPLFVENDLKDTPCDSAEKAENSDIALYLESKMVFSNTEHDVIEQTESLVIENVESYSGLRAQDLQEAKDQLLVETSDMLRVPLFTAEALLRNHEWSREMLLEAWMADSKACCEKCGVIPPSNVVNEHTAPDHELRSPLCRTESIGATVCDICAMTMIEEEEDPVSILCEHQFCRNCWEGYLNVKIKDGDTHNITCPGYGCSKLVPVEILESLVSRDMARRYLQFDIKAFVEGNPNIKWCPFPGCGRAVKLPGEDDATSPITPSIRRERVEDTSRAVDCGNGHLFCWDCLGDSHEPCSCDCWVTWQGRIAEVKVEELGGVEKQSESAANCLWLVTNSKPCPNCKSPIQKNEGCNHMKCSKCKHDFCWVCLEPWKKHSSATGGYFRCNRYEFSKKVEHDQESQVAEAHQRNQELQDRKKFVHYYTRFRNHENSYKLETPLLSTAKNKMMELARAVHSTEQSASSEVVFVEEAIQQLLKARRVLKCSYVYGFYLEDEGIKKQVFESMQTELEECTENLSEMIARPYLRTPRSRIIKTAQLVSRKRHEFVTAISKGLVPAEFSPRGRKKFTYEITEDLRKSIMESMSDHDTSQQPWARDPRTGRHANLEAILDWPVESDDSDAESQKSSSPQEQAVLDICQRNGCDKPKARNPRTGDLHNHCSLRCLRRDRIEQAEREERMVPSDFVTDYQVDLLRALEMSRLQLMREMASIGPPGDSPSGQRSSWKPSAIDKTSSHFPNLVLDDENIDSLEDFDPDFQRALEMSRLSFQNEDNTYHNAIKLSLENEDASQVSPSCARKTDEQNDCSNHDDGVHPCCDGAAASRPETLNSVLDVSSDVFGCSSNAESKEEEADILDDLEQVSVNLKKMLDVDANDDIEDSDADASVLQDETAHMGNEVVLPKRTTFGLIKDISVTNLISTDQDKTQTFKNKDFKHMCSDVGSQSGSSFVDIGEASVSGNYKDVHQDFDFNDPSHVCLKLGDFDEFGTSTTEDDFDHLLASIQNPGLLPKVDNATNSRFSTGSSISKSLTSTSKPSSGRTSSHCTDTNDRRAPLLLNNCEQKTQPQTREMLTSLNDLDPQDSHMELQSVIRALENITSRSESIPDDECETEDRNIDNLSLKEYEGHEYANM